jgi:putative transposase
MPGLLDIRCEVVDGAGMPYWRLFYHVIWATKHRAPMVTDAMIGPITRAIEETARESGVTVFAVGVMPDHVHVLAQIPPTLTLSAIIGNWKGASSYAANSQVLGSPTKLAWQSGYGVLSVSERSFKQVRAYVQHQRERHAAREVYGAYERTESPSNERSSSAFRNPP